MKLDYLLITLPNQACLTFIGSWRDLDAQTVELCSPEGRPIMRVPRSYVTPTTREATAQRILADARHRRGLHN